jgi:alpha-L-rhamnosidase
LPFAMQALIKFSIRAKKGTVLNIKTDRYGINGGPGGENDIYNAHRIEYVCKDGVNEFTSNYYLFGEEFIITASDKVDIIEIGYIDTGYDCDIVGKFNCSCEITNKLVEKAARTLYVCMRDNFMDCPDRERGQWIGDVAVQVPQVFFLLSESAKPLVKKTIYDFINLRKGDVLLGCVPGICFAELPAQSLNAIGEYGIISTYYKYTNDLDVVKFSFDPCVKYLMLWEMGDDGLVVQRKGDWSWFDHLYNIDDTVLENAWYYSALKFARKSADLLDNHVYDSFLNERLDLIKQNFNEKFWNGEYYSSGKVVDDRANAMAVIAGLCEPENYPRVRSVLLKVFNATVYMENYVLEALCLMGYIKDAYNRMVSRYYNLAVNENSTLWEDFFILGTKNHAWSGAPATIAFKYFMGIDTNDGFKTYTTNPVKDIFDSMSCEFYIQQQKICLEYSK